MQIKLSGLVLLAGLVLCGCPSPKRDLQDADALAKKMTVPDTTFLTISEGASLEGVRNTLGLAARHEFTVAATSGNYTLLDCSINETNGLFLLFRDKTLLKIIDPAVPFAQTRSPEPIAAGEIKFWGTENGWIIRPILKSISAPALTHDQIVECLKPYSGPHSNNELPGFLVKGVLYAGASRMKKDLLTTIDLLQRYDGSRASLGLNPTAVEKLYDKPYRIIKTKDGQIIWIYRDSRATDDHPEMAYVNLAVVFDPTGHVSAIYNDGFFPDEWKKAAEKSP